MFAQKKSIDAQFGQKSNGMNHFGMKSQMHRIHPHIEHEKMKYDLEKHHNTIHEHFK